MTKYAPNLAHMGIACIDIDKMITFYTQVFDLHLTDRGIGGTFKFPLAFMSASPTQHHQIALAQSRAPGTPSTVMQVSFKVDTLDNLREARDRALKEGATKMRGLNHGNAMSIYFMDPEENTVEVYLDTPWYVAQPHGDPLDLDKPDTEIWAETEKIVRADPTFMPVSEWSANFKK
jgi:catechol 2,3-dioxygenase